MKILSHSSSSTRVCPCQYLGSASMHMHQITPSNSNLLCDMTDALNFFLFVSYLTHSPPWISFLFFNFGSKTQRNSVANIFLSGRNTVSLVTLVTLGFSGSVRLLYVYHYMCTVSSEKHWLWETFFSISLVHCYPEDHEYGVRILENHFFHRRRKGAGLVLLGHVGPKI